TLDLCAAQLLPRLSAAVGQELPVADARILRLDPGRQGLETPGQSRNLPCDLLRAAQIVGVRARGYSDPIRFGLTGEPEGQGPLRLGQQGVGSGRGAVQPLSGVDEVNDGRLEDASEPSAKRRCQASGPDLMGEVAAQAMLPVELRIDRRSSCHEGADG